MNQVAAPKGSEKPQIDPITLEVIRHGIISVCDQIDANMTRTAFSPYIYEYKDYAVGFVGAAGELLAQSTGGMPVFVADSVGMAVQRRFGNLRPGKSPQGRRHRLQPRRGARPTFK